MGFYEFFADSPATLPTPVLADIPAPMKQMDIRGGSGEGEF
jgi:hypothetical protein